jgi:hypothetical protein
LVRDERTLFCEILEVDEIKNMKIACLKIINWTLLAFITIVASSSMHVKALTSADRSLILAWGITAAVSIYLLKQCMWYRDLLSQEGVDQARLNSGRWKRLIAPMVGIGVIFSAFFMGERSTAHNKPTSEEILTKRFEDGSTLLMHLAKSGETETVRKFVRLGADVMATNRYGETAINWAAQRGIYKYSRNP